MARGARLPSEAWTPRDWALAQAAKILDWTRCPGCGQPRWLAHDPRSYWKPEKVKCESCAAQLDLQATMSEEDPHRAAWHFRSELVKIGG